VASGAGRNYTPDEAIEGREPDRGHAGRLFVVSGAAGAGISDCNELEGNSRRIHIPMMEKEMWDSIKTYVLILPVFLLIDLTWLGKIMVNFYKSELGALVRLEGDSLAPVLWAAIVVYLLIPLGIVLFALPRVDPQNVLVSSLSWGFVYGVILYGVYDMTNYSLLNNYPLRMAVVDIAWGGVLCAVVTSVAAMIDRLLK
jgi:uncharacterized membrane protein